MTVPSFTGADELMRSLGHGEDQEYLPHDVVDSTHCRAIIASAHSIASKST